MVQSACVISKAGTPLSTLATLSVLAVGVSVAVTLEFANAGTIEVPAEVLPPGDMEMDSQARAF